MSDSPSSSHSSASTQPHEELSLSHAMKAADSVRRHFNQAKQYSSDETSAIFAPTIPPGIAQGVGACLVVGAALLPVRRLVLAHPSVNSHQAFRNFIDLVASVGHALLATQAALITGSIYGGKTYLDEFAKQKSFLTDSSSASCMLCKTICKEIRSSIVPPETRWPARLDTASFDPRVQTMLSMVRVIEMCQERES